MNIEWIDCGLPFEAYVTDRPLMPDMEKIFREEFGDNFMGFYIPYINETCEPFMEENIDNISEAQFVAMDEIEKEYGPIERIDYLNEDHMRLFRTALMPWFQNNKDEVEKVIQFRKFRTLYNNWFEDHPLIVEWKQIVSNLAEEAEKQSFAGRKLNQPGTLIEVEVNGELKQYMIGHINTNRGVCDDCTEFDSDCIVKRYAIIIKFEED